MSRSRAMSINALCIYLDIDFKTWVNYRQSEKFMRMTTRAEEVIRQQKFEGAAADTFNAMIVARDLGLRDNSSVEHGVSDDSVTKIVRELVKPKDRNG